MIRGRADAAFAVCLAASSAAAALAACLAAWPAPAGASDLRAERIEPQTAAELQIGGTDAIGGVGDWYLANDVVEVIVDDPSRRHAKLDHGGTIVDAGLRDRRGEDQFARLFPLVNMDQRVILGFDAIRAEVDAGGRFARLVVSGRDGLTTIPRGGFWRRWLDPMVPEAADVASVTVETEYRVAPGEPFVHITTTIRNEGERPAPVFAYGDVWMRGGRSIRAWVGNTLEPERSRGFHHLSFDRRNLLAASEALAPFTFVSAPGAHPHPAIAYALVYPERAAAGRVQFGVTGKHVTFSNAFLFDPARDPNWPLLSLWRLLRATRQELAPGAAWTARRRLLITAHSDVASTTDVIFPLLGVADGSSGIAGRVVPGDARAVILVEAAGSGHPVTSIAPHRRGPAAGSYRTVLPPGDYVLTLRAEQRAERRFEVRVRPGRFTEVEPQRLEEPGWLVFDPAFADGGPGRIIVRGVGNTPTPVFDPELLDFRLDGQPVDSGSEVSELFFVGSDRDPRRVAVPPGSYELFGVRGLEHDLARVSVVVPGPGARAVVPPLRLERRVRPAGVLRADLHVHAQASDDSSTPNEARLRQFVAAGVDVMVTSDHDHLGHFGPALDALGVRDQIHVVQGVEVTSSAPSWEAPWTIGHSNAWPIPYRARAHRKGAPASQNRTLADLYASLRADYGARVVQLNHPRDGDPGGVEEGAFWTHLGDIGEPFDPRRPIHAYPNNRLLAVGADGSTRAVDFDAVEIMNGRSFDEFRLVREDWYALLRQGLRRTGTANSDTHGLDRPAGMPRNYVVVDPNRYAAAPGAEPVAGPVWDPVVFDEAIRRGRVFGTNGPLITDFRVNGGGMGELVGAPDGEVTVVHAVAAVSWVPVDEVRVLVNGEVAVRYDDLPAAGSGPPMRSRQHTDLDLERDAFITVEAGASLDADPVSWAAERGGVYAEVVARGYVSTAFTNPVYVDVDGNGRFDPPGPFPPERGTPALLLLSGLVTVATGLAWGLRRRVVTRGP